MEEIFEKLYNTFLTLLDNLAIGYPLTYENVQEIWELIHLIDFITNGNPTESEMLWIADKYENSRSSLLDVAFDDEFDYD